MKTLFVSAVVSLVIVPLTATSAEFKPVKSVDELNWLVGTWMASVNSLQETELGPIGTPIKVSLNWTKRYDGSVLVNEVTIESSGTKIHDALVVMAFDAKAKCVVGFQFTKTGVGRGKTESDGRSIRWKVDSEPSPMGEVSGYLAYQRIDEDSFELRSDGLKVAGQPLPIAPPPATFKRQK